MVVEWGVRDSTRYGWVVFDITWSHPETYFPLSQTLIGVLQASMKSLHPHSKPVEAPHKYYPQLFAKFTKLSLMLTPYILRIGQIQVLRLEEIMSCVATSWVAWHFVSALWTIQATSLLVMKLPLHTSSRCNRGDFVTKQLSVWAAQIRSPVGAAAPDRSIESQSRFYFTQMLNYW